MEEKINSKFHSIKTNLPFSYTTYYAIILALLWFRDKSTFNLLAVIILLMKKFVLKAIAFSFPIIVGIFVLELLLRNIPNEYLFKKQYLDQHSSKIETLILGSSHSYYGLDPKYFSTNTFNASHVSQSLNYDFEILKKYQNKFNNLKTIVLPISYFSLFAKLETGSESWRIKNYMIYYDMNTSKSIINYSEILSNKSNVNLKRIISYYLAGNSTISCSKLGWGTSYNSANSKDLNETGKISAIRHTRENINSKMHQKAFQENLLLIDSILQWADKNDINILLFTPPAFETYRKNLSSEQLQLTINTTRDICSKYKSCDYEFLLSDSRFQTEDFYDGDHLSEIGAKKLSILINDEINDF